MINKFKALEKNFSINKAAIIIGVFTILSRLTGLIRDRMFASGFGAGDTLDAYYAAFRIPDFIYNLLILGTLSIAFIPIFSELIVKDKIQANKTANTVLNASIILVSVTCLLAFLFSKFITKALVPGFTEEKLHVTINLTRLFLLSPIIFTISNVFSSILNAQKKFIAVGLAPILYNLGIIVGLFIFYPKFGIYGVGLGVILGAVMHLLIQIPAVVKSGFTWLPIINFNDKAFLKITKLFIPKILGLDNSQISLLIGSMVGSLLASGSIAVLNLANNLQAVPVGIFGISIALASFPLLSEAYAKHDENQFLKALGDSIVQILFFILPVTVLFLLLRAHIVRLVYGTGNFTWENTILTFQTLGVFSLSLFSQAISPLLSRCFYARQNTIIPVMINSLVMVLNALGAYFFGKLYGVWGIALGFSISSMVSVILLYITLNAFLQKKIDMPSLKQFNFNVLMSTLKILLATFISGLAIYFCLYFIEPFVNTRTGIGLLVQAGFASFMGIVIYLLFGYQIKIKQVDYYIRLLTLWRKT
jgi:putative peptidoglycan lipid II flippase